jgi:hypothetical protein
MERITLLARVRGPPISPDLNPCGENSKVLCMPTIRMTWRLWNRIFMKQFTTFNNVNCNKFPEICLREFRRVSQQRVDILNIIYDGEYNIYYYIWLIINERSKQCVLTVPAARKHFYRQVTQRFRKKLPTAKSVSNQSALWTPDIYSLDPKNIFLITIILTFSTRILVFGPLDSFLLCHSDTILYFFIHIWECTVIVKKCISRFWGFTSFQ